MTTELTELATIQGSTIRQVVTYALMPGVPAVVGGVTYALQPYRG